MRQRPNMFSNTLSNLNDEGENATSNSATTISESNNCAKQPLISQQLSHTYLTTTSNQSNSDNVVSSAIAANTMILKNKSKSILFK
jgi:hypothetical protein